MLPNISREVFTITDIENRTSRNNDEQMYVIELTDIVNDHVYTTFIVESHENFALWERMIQNKDRYYLLTNLKLKQVKSGPNTGNYYVNGDSRVRIAAEIDDQNYFDFIVKSMRGEALPPHLNRELWEPKHG